MAFGTQFQDFFGSEGQFTVEREDGEEVTAKYVQTKIRPSTAGQWEDQLTSHMKPWREVFDIQDMKFDELLQRNLDDPRVANDLIPYLLGKENRYPFFPPILAILAPTPETNRSGIEKAYPEPQEYKSEGVTGRRYGEVFETRPYVCEGEKSPITRVGFNPHRTAFVIADGQHRAMAILALFRQYRNKWEDEQEYRSFYDHIEPKQEQIESLELPVCVLYFPELYEGSEKLEKLENGLITISRQVFLDVNKEAREVSHARQLLLDDTDFGAVLMRRVLSEVQQQERTPERAELLSFEYNDDEAVERPTQRSPLKITSSAAIYAMTRALSFGSSDAFQIDSGADLTDGRRCQSTTRARELTGYRPEKEDRIKINRVKEYGPEESNEITDRLSRLWKPVLPGMYHSLHPFQAHNKAVANFREVAQQKKRRASSDDTISRAVNLLLSLGPERMHFRRHKERVESEGASAPLRDEEELREAADDFEAVEATMSDLEEEFENIRLKFFWDKYSTDTDESLSDLQEEAGNAIFDVVTTQAFQMGVTMTVASLFEYLRDVDEQVRSFDRRAEATEFLGELVYETVNEYFAVGEDEEESTDLDVPRFVTAFGDGRRGFMDLLRTPRGRTLGANNYKFFRYMLTEILFSDSGLEVQNRMLADDSYPEAVRREYLSSIRANEGGLTEVVEDLADARTNYINRYADAALKTQEFKNELQEAEIQMRQEERPESEISDKLQSMKEERRDSASSDAWDRIRNSVDLIPQGLQIQETINQKLAVASGS